MLCKWRDLHFCIKSYQKARKKCNTDELRSTWQSRLLLRELSFYCSRCAVVEQSGVWMIETLPDTHAVILLKHTQTSSLRTQACPLLHFSTLTDQKNGGKIGERVWWELTRLDILPAFINLHSQRSVVRIHGHLANINALETHHDGGILCMGEKNMPLTRQNTQSDKQISDMMDNENIIIYWWNIVSVTGRIIK